MSIYGANTNYIYTDIDDSRNDLNKLFLSGLVTPGITSISINITNQNTWTQGSTTPVLPASATQGKYMLSFSVVSTNNSTSNTTLFDCVITDRDPLDFADETTYINYVFLNGIMGSNGGYNIPLTSSNLIDHSGLPWYIWLRVNGTDDSQFSYCVNYIGPLSPIV